jgi:hypothetical protein
MAGQLLEEAHGSRRQGLVLEDPGAVRGDQGEQLAR